MKYVKHITFNVSAPLVLMHVALIAFVTLAMVMTMPSIKLVG